MMKKSHTFIICILMFFSIFSVGFASWTIVFNPETVAKGTIETDTVEKNNYITFAITEGPKSNQDGFFTSDSGQRNKIKLDASIDLVSFMSIFSNGAVNSVQASFVLTYAENVTASTTVFEYIKTTVTMNEETVEHNYQIINNQPTLTINLSGDILTTNPNFEIIFAFENLDASYFTSSISPFTQSGSIFAVTARLSVLNEEVA